MLILTKNLWKKYHIIKVHCSDNWEGNDVYLLTECVLKELKDFLVEARDKKKLAILICDLCKGKFPPITNIIQIVSFFLSVRDLLLTSLNFTVFYSKSGLHKLWIDRILSIYTPVRPVYIVETKTELKKLIKLTVLDHTSLI